ncbi:meiosis protein [Pelomyxa schiedti]|nr:meiosis protein [Pelomyxa schiedti]
MITIPAPIRKLPSAPPVVFSNIILPMLDMAQYQTSMIEREEAFSFAGPRFTISVHSDGSITDPRTTLMIKNIPNKYTQRMILEEINRNHSGSYDFFYLPIDFKNKCNVGYAFINMVSTDRISAFLSEFMHTRWSRFNSEKICQITYARIQGLTSLIDHFKTSSLLAEEEKVRPVVMLNGELRPFPVGVELHVVRCGCADFVVTDDHLHLYTGDPTELP